MRFGLECLILLSLFLIKSNAAPPGEVGARTRYTNEEDEFIIKEVLRCANDNLPLASKYLWQSVAKKHRKKREQNPDGFPQERTAKSLRSRLRDIIKSPRLRTKVPDALLERYRPDLNKSPRGSRQPYTPEEENFIIEELSKPSCTQVYAASEQEALRAKHHEKWKANVPGFKYERTARSLNSHLTTMKHNGQLPEAVVKKLWNHDKEASSSRPTTQNEGSDLENMDEEYESEDEML